MTSKLIVNNIEADSGVSTITFGSEISASKITTSSTSAFSSGLNVTGGNVGIGTDSAEALLDVEGIGQFGNNPLTDTGIQLNGSVGRIRVGRSGNVFEARNGSDSTIKASISGSTGGANFLGSVGIGTDSPVSGVKLHLQDTSACRIQLSTDSTGHTSSDGARLMIDSSNNFEILNRENASIEFFTNNTQRWSINSAGNLVAASSGLGIDFSATGDGNGTDTSELLDDYEEGTWTPTLPSGGTIGSINNATYTKVGRLVTLYFYLGQISGIPNNGSIFQIGGLPYNAVSGNWYGAGQIGYSGTKDLSVWRPLVSTGNAYVYFHRTDGSSSTLGNSSAIGTADLLIAIWYFTA